MNPRHDVRPARPDPLTAVPSRLSSATLGVLAPADISLVDATLAADGAGFGVAVALGALLCVVVVGARRL